VVAKAQVALKKAKRGTDDDKQVLLKELDAMNKLLGSGEEADLPCMPPRLRFSCSSNSPKMFWIASRNSIVVTGANWKTRSEEGFRMQLLQAEALIQLPSRSPRLLSKEFHAIILRRDEVTSTGSCEMPLFYRILRHSH